jgi:DNA-binding winged helix-turn-helix (wHTH) protein
VPSLALCYRPCARRVATAARSISPLFEIDYRPRALYGGHKVQFVFADHTLDIDRRELRRGSESIAVEPQVLDLLICLVQNRNRVVTKDDLIASVWGGRIVSETTLTSRIYAARKAVGDSGHGQKLIRTIARKGLRFVGDVRAEPNGAEPALATDPPLLDELREPSRLALPLPERPVIAVLPFLNMCADPA